MGSWIQAMGPPGSTAELLDLSRGGPFGESPATAALLEMLRSLPDVNLPGTISRNGAALQFHISTGPGQEVPPELRALFGLRGGSRYESRRETTEPGHAAFFVPQSTIARWTEEAKILFGGDFQSVSASLKTAIDAVLVPPAVEAEKVKKAIETERVRMLEEEAKKRQEEERIAKEAKEAEEKLAREEREAEEAETALRLAAEALAERGDDPEAMQDDAAEPSTAPGAMEGIEGSSSTDPPASDESPAEDRPRVTTIIRGNTMDITDLGIDPEFLAELPEELREEVIMSAVAERRSQAAATGAQPSEIDQEFLDALPEDIRDEIIQSERQERRRREREEQRRQAGMYSHSFISQRYILEFDW
jgi:E3 ubiquitin-protein ligase HUWE1